jgi:hypothetical protein
MMLLAYAVFFRYSELSELRVCEVSIFPSHVRCFIQSSKTDQYREGAWVLIAATGNSTCPVFMLRKYMNLGGIVPGSSEDFLFRPVVFMKSTSKYVLRGGVSWRTVLAETCSKQPFHQWA